MEKVVNYWRKSYRVQAVRITEHNIEELSKELGVELYVTGYENPYLYNGKTRGYLGDWAMVDGADSNLPIFLDDETFKKNFRTHSEQASQDERYAKIHSLVAVAMAKQDAATYHQDQTGMDLIAIETTKKIIGEL